LWPSAVSTSKHACRISEELQITETICVSGQPTIA
jgi:hypothetical protein